MDIDDSNDSDEYSEYEFLSDSEDYLAISQQSLTLQAEESQESLLPIENISHDWGAHFKISTSADNVPPPSRTHLDVLNSQFNQKEFKDPQWKVISRVLNFLETKESSSLKDQFIIAASGFGKSLCFQFVPVYTNCLALVISPLISLMHDQVRLMNSLGIPAVCLSPAKVKSGHILTRMHEFRVAYITPELCINRGQEFILELHEKTPFCLVAIDEAHCISAWGHDFRTKYRRLSLLRNWLPHVPFIALTATASIRVTEDVIKSLQLRNTVVYTTLLNRQNLYYEVYPRTYDCVADLKILLTLKSTSPIQYTFSGPCIIYCITRKRSEEICKVVQNLGIGCDFYHAGMRKIDRENVHGKFVRDEIQCIVATIAFGMGIDKPDVRLVVHYGAPKEMESYMQESGRAGRDGLPSKCIIFYSKYDFGLIRHILVHKTSNMDAEVVKNRIGMFEKVKNFLGSNQCRRKQLLENLDQELPISSQPSDHCCDNCTIKNESFRGSLKRQSSGNRMEMLPPHDNTQSTSSEKRKRN